MTDLKRFELDFNWCHRHAPEQEVRGQHCHCACAGVALKYGDF
jgi:hypothetical protein